MTKALPIGPVMIDIAGMDLTAYDREKISHPNTGGVILFTRNYAEPDQIISLINAIRSARTGTLLLAVDQEGGRVQRFQQGFTCLPAASLYAEQIDDDAKSAGWLMAAELRAVGIDFSFAPVLDVDCGISTIIGNRSFAKDPELAARLAGNFRQGMHSAGMAAVGKHFPGHGGIALDSHLEVPVDERDLVTLHNRDLIPFKKLIIDGLEGIMPAHVVYPDIDTLPAGFSSIWIQQLLRKELGFNGAVFSDDLSMAGAASAGDFVERARLAQQAGCDMMLICNNPKAAEKVLDSTPIQQDPIRNKRLTNMLGKLQIPLEQLHNTEKWQTLSNRISSFTEA